MGAPVAQRAPSVGHSRQPQPWASNDQVCVARPLDTFDSLVVVTEDACGTPHRRCPTVPCQRKEGRKRRSAAEWAPLLRFHGCCAAIGGAPDRALPSRMDGARQRKG
ncbi:unnamed protein product [Prorocentrum cordatum]|uniref:Uncharacterized protein n=1 Tax=Prorocentrum cordatum TaxID=2364126 RepID=A0ABN9TN07_9DINO|nr:unnamed protein product [Polarella glacialis]